MRYYRIDLSDNSGKPLYLKSLGQTLTSVAPNGVANPGALNIELDAPVYPYSTGDAANTYVKIWGVGLQDLGLSLDLNGQIVTPSTELVDKKIVVRGGMSKGLPLANPAQQGVLLQGSVFQAFGNWRGTEMSLVLVVGPATGTQDQPVQFPFTWTAGTPLATALSNVLSVAFPGLKQQISISSNLVLGYTETGYYQSLRQFATWLNQRTQPIIGGTYDGVHISTNGTSVVVWDGTVAPAADAVTQIAPQDLIGQPMWHSLSQITFQTVMRGDIGLQDVVKLPDTILSQDATAMLRFRDKTAFSGKFRVQKMHHFGNFRQPDAASWNTTFWATPEAA